MLKPLYLFITIVSVTFGLGFLKSELVHAQYEPPIAVEVSMYSLQFPSGGMFSPPIPCTNDDQSYGCTAISGDPEYDYPFNKQTITIGIDDTSGPDNSGQYDYPYLKDVIAQEMSPTSFLQPAMDAQAVAARTYAYWHMKATGRLTNSNSHHVFLPYRYQQFSPENKSKIDKAVENRYYMSYHEAFFNGFQTVADDAPIFSEFSSDAYERTVTHAEQDPRHPYMVSVEEPISFHPDIPPLITATNAHERGQSQNGAGRWARGSSSYRCDPAPAPCPGIPPSIPHTAWSVRWKESFQILTHYYTGIHIRDANPDATGAINAIKTPEYRWNPLSIEWLGTGPSFVCEVIRQRSGCRFRTRVQNLGT